jgi:fibronectin type 3 domain-containing protein
VTNELLAGSSMAKSAVDMRLQETFIMADWDMANIWGVCAGNDGLPHFRHLHQCSHNPPYAVRLSGITDTGHIELSWNNPEHGSCGTLVGYAVLRNGDEIGFTTENSFIDISAENGTLNTYHVVAVYENTTGTAMSLPLELPTFLMPMLQITSIDHCSVVLSWEFSVPTPTIDNSVQNSRRYSTDGSRILRTLSSFHVYFGEELIAEVTENTYTHSSSHPTHPVSCGNNTYFYHIIAIFSDPDGERGSERIEVSLPTDHHFPVPTSLETTQVASGQVSLSWTEPAAGHCGTLVSYSVYFGVENTPTSNFMNTTETSMTIPGLVNGTTYFFVVRANYVEHTGTSGNSNTVFATPDPTSDSDMLAVPANTELLANFPNPFNPETFIRFALEKDDNVQIEIYNVRGQKVKTLLDTNLKAGYHQAVWNGTDQHGRDLSSGIYFYRMTSEK